MNNLTNWPLVGGVLAGGLLLGFLLGQGSVAVAPPNPQARALDADTWIQTSAEYHACCLQTYRFAWERLRDKLARLPKEGLPPAVILDLDETVLDNSPFQTWMYRWRLGYDQSLWDRWEEDFPDEVRVMPGAADFLRNAENAGLTVYYISNRNQRTADSTRKALDHLGLSTRDFDRRFLGRTSQTGNDKDSRRETVRKGHRVLMLLGDNLRDFSDEFKAPEVKPTDGPELRKGIAERKAKVDRERAKFGEEWVILPNPVYGEWAKLQGADPLEVLNPSRMPGP
ncbi:MAG: HAD family acid phosphatase [Gemmataceae bacterium]